MSETTAELGLLMQLTRIDRIGRSILTLNRDREYAILKGMLAVSPTDSVLDVGSGDGFWTVRFAKSCTSVTGLEPDERTLGIARKLSVPIRFMSAALVNPCHFQMTHLTRL